MNGNYGMVRTMDHLVTNTLAESSPTEPVKAFWKEFEVVDCVRRLGGACSTAILDPSTLIFSIDTVDGLIGYRLEHGTAVVYGDPVCLQDDWEALVAAFHRDCEEKGIGVVYIATSKAFALWAHERYCKTLIQFGEELILDPQNDPQKLTGTRASLVRRKIRHAAKEGVVVKELVNADPEIEAHIQEVCDRWVRERAGLQIHISTIRVFADRLGKRWFYAQQGDKIVGVVILNELQHKQGWLMNHLMHVNGIGGIPESLVCTALETIAKEGCRYVTVGTVIAPQLGEIMGLGRFSAWLYRKAFRAVIWMFQLDARIKFWEKFHPNNEPLFLLFARHALNIRELTALSKALNIRVSKGAESNKR